MRTSARFVKYPELQGRRDAAGIAAEVDADFEDQIAGPLPPALGEGLEIQSFAGRIGERDHVSFSSGPSGRLDRKALPFRLVRAVEEGAFRLAEFSIDPNPLCAKK